MSDRVNPEVAAKSAVPNVNGTAVRVVALAVVLYGFLVSIGMIGKSFKMFSGGFIGDLIQSASDPVIGLFVGILVTSLVQSSSTTTSLVVALVGSGTMPVATAIPVVMGANIGTSVTNILVSLGHINRGREFRRAYAAANVHDFFNVFAVLILFPLQLTTNFLGILSTGLAELFYDIGGLTFASPLKLVTAPAVAGAADVIGHHPWLMLVASLVLMFVTLRQLVVLLKKLVISRVEALFDEVIFRTAGRAMVFGLFITALVQSSSVTTSLAVPLAGAGILTIQQIFPYTLGANVGTTITAMLAALAVGDVSAVTVALAHMLFNVCGIVVIWPIPAIRRLPIVMAEKMTDLAMYSRVIPIVWVLFFFFALPAAVIYFLRLDMFKQFFELFRKDNMLQQAYDRSLEMLEADREMFLAAASSLREHNDARIELDIYAKDQMINAYEREVRRKVLTHMALSTSRSISAGLALVSIVIDIERIGDLTKNIVDLALRHPGKLDCGSLEPDVRKIETTVKTMFSLLIEALPKGDVAKAKEVMSEHWWIARRADEILNSLIVREDPDLVCREAVSAALYVRFLKRISAHLMNIASSVVNPFDRIGFREDDFGQLVDDE